jgi:F-type H+-transporting ATPase subunit gamma
METLESLGKRIATTQDLQSIVRTMKSLSVVSIRQYEQAAAALAEYHRTIEQGFQILLREGPPPGIRAAPGDFATAAIVFGSDHGLCGRFNEQIARFAHMEMQRRIAIARDRAYLAVGVQAAARLESFDEPIDDCLFLPGAVSGLTATANAILLKVHAWQQERGIGRVFLFHNRRAADATAAPAMAQLLPLDARWLREIALRPWPSRGLPTHRMRGPALFASLVREHLFVSIYRAAAESMASEHATRMASMQAAERNIQEHLAEMTGAYRRRRQEAITEELLDIVGGYESLRRAGGSRRSG